MAKHRMPESAATHEQRTPHAYAPLDPYELSMDRWIGLTRQRATGGSRKTSIDDINVNLSSQFTKPEPENTAGPLPPLLERPCLGTMIPNYPPGHRHSDPLIAIPRTESHASRYPHRTPTAPADSAAPTYRTSGPATRPPSYHHKSEIFFEAEDEPQRQVIVHDNETDSPESIYAPGFTQEGLGPLTRRATREHNIPPREPGPGQHHPLARRDSQVITEIPRWPTGPQEPACPDNTCITTVTPQPGNQWFVLPSRPSQPAPKPESHSPPFTHKELTKEIDIPSSLHQHGSFAARNSDPESLGAKKRLDFPPTTREYLRAFFLENAPRQIYMVFLLFLPRVYFSRVNAIFEDTEMTLKKIKEVALTAGMEESNILDEQLSAVFKHDPPKSYQRLKRNWEAFIDNLMREWKTLNVVSALLLTGILTILQIDRAAGDFYTRYTALFSFIDALISLMFGCVYIVQFATMRKIHKGAEWAMEAINEQTILWNVWVMVALPGVFLAWSILLFTASILCFTWRVSYKDLDSNRLSSIPDGVELISRIAICLLLATGTLYGVRVMIEFRRYGRTMDEKWRERVKEHVAKQVPEYKSVDNQGSLQRTIDRRTAEVVPIPTVAAPLTPSQSYETLPTSSLIQQAYELKLREQESWRPGTPASAG